MIIYKHRLNPGEVITINCVRPLSVIEQDNRVTMYALHDLENEHNNVPHRFNTVGTGWDLKEYDAHMDLPHSTFLGTVKIGSYVWHVFYKGKAV